MHQFSKSQSAKNGSKNESSIGGWIGALASFNKADAMINYVLLDTRLTVVLVCNTDLLEIWITNESFHQNESIF